MRRPAAFTLDDDWHGGFYELAIEVGDTDDERLDQALRAVWAGASIQGCYIRRDIEPSAQAPVQCSLARANNLTKLTALLRAAQLGTRVRRALTEMITEVAGLNQRVHDLETTIRKLVTPLAPALLKVIGISHISAVILIAEIGDITRFASSARLARYTGCAPIPVYSADKERHRLHRGGNRRLNSVVYIAAAVQQRFDPAGRHYWPATSRRRAVAAPAASSSATSLT